MGGRRLDQEAIGRVGQRVHGGLCEEAGRDHVTVTELMSHGSSESACTRRSGGSTGELSGVEAVFGDPLVASGEGAMLLPLACTNCPSQVIDNNIHPQQPVVSLGVLQQQWYHWSPPPICLVYRNDYTSQLILVNDLGQSGGP